MNQRKIMIVEDEGITAMNIQSSLEDMGYTITSTAFTGESAVRKAAADNPDLIMMDIILDGEIDGIEAARQIQSAHDVPVVYLTAHSDQKMLNRIKTTSPFGYIMKPFDSRELQITVELAFYKHEMERKLKQSNDNLEAKVKERTAELEATVLLLRSAETKLRVDAEQLEESNTALKVLLKQRIQDRDEFENNIMSNVKNLILPYLGKLKKHRTIPDELDYLAIIDSNLNAIISPFSARLSFQYMNFTPREIMVSNLIKDGKQDKDIMEILNISLDTVKAHRKNIRKKLGINNQKVNLRSKLLSLAK